MAGTIPCYLLLSLHQVTPKCGLGEINFVGKRISILDTLYLSCLWHIQMGMCSRQQHMWAWSSGDRSDVDLGIIIIIVGAENEHEPQNMRVDAALQGACASKAEG